MSGKRVLVTGATAGIGKQTALELAKLGAEVIIVGRNADKTAAVVESLRQESGTVAIDSLLADLSSMASIRTFAAAFLAKYDRLDVLVNNAGALFLKREVTVDGWERTFATNHLSYFLVAHLLMPAIERAGAGARIVNVSSAAHPAARLDFDDLMAERSRYSSFRQYGRSKLANIFFTQELSRRLASKQITVNCLHPGFVASEFLAKGGVWSLIKPISGLFAVDVVAGAKTSVYLASSPDVAAVSGKYFDKCKEKQPNKIANDAAAAARLWQVSAQLCGI